MQFHIDEDAGSSISGWLVPDNPTSTPAITVASPGHKTVELPANVLRTDLKDLGLHSTGMAGFWIDDNLYPGLSALDDVEIHDATTRILIYRRLRHSHHLPRKLFLYGLYAMPQTQLDRILAGHFDLHYDAIEQHSFDTLFSIINNQFSNSIFVSGRPRFYRYQQLLRERGFIVATLLRDPYEELAERLLFIRYASSAGSPAFAAAHMTGLECLVDVVKRIDFGDKNSIAHALTSLTDQQRQVLSDPFVRTLACTLDELPEPKHVSIALENLAGMDLVGLTSRFDDFKSMLNEIMAADVLTDCKLTEVSWVPVIATQLKQIDQIASLLTLDLELFSSAQPAISKALDAA